MLKQLNSKTCSFTRFISNDFIDLDFPRKDSISVERGFSTKFSCLDEALNGQIKQGLYVLFSTEQKPSLGLMTQLAEAAVEQEFGAIFVFPMNYLSILPAFIYSRQSLLYDFPNAKPVEQLLPFSSEIRHSLSKTVQEKGRALTQNMAFLHSYGLKPPYFKTQMESLFQYPNKFICFIDASDQNQDDFLLNLQAYHQLTEEWAIPIFIYRKIPLRIAQNDFNPTNFMDEACQYADYAIFMKRYSTQKTVLSNINQQTPDWLLYQIHVMSSYLSPEFSTSFLSFYHQFGLFEEA
ncbi:hypothetical protein [Neobacillus drentensis]|uniref:hypothetical protein n=1 Tax=Neobacillus drentensis TaxID=220684 RepID=UPI002FFFE7D9